MLGTHKRGVLGRIDGCRQKREMVLLLMVFENGIAI